MVRNGSRKSVLVVEDDLSICNLIERVMRSIKPNIILDWSTSSEEAIKLIEEASRKKNPEPYQLIVCDFYLEGPKTGLDFWYFCKKIYPNIPFILMSSADLDDFFQNDESGDAPFFLRKPFDVAKCRSFLSIFLNQEMA